MTLKELEENIKKYLLLEDKGIVKLLCATVIANRLPQLDPTWLFVVSSSSGGKSELLLALSKAAGCIPKDDLTAKTFISGAKSGAVQTSLLYRLPVNPIMIVKDLTVLLKKDVREADAIFSQLRMIYDGTFNKSFGTGEDIDVVVKMGFIAGVTSEIEDHQSDEAAVGQRAIKYYMQQPPDEEIDQLTEDIINGKQDKQMREMIGESFRQYLDLNEWGKDGVIPELSKEIRVDISQLANMATKSRSSIKRKLFSRDNPITRKNLREMPFRFGKQLANLAKAFMIMNQGELTGLDKKILYKIAIDSIPSSRKEVMEAATGHNLGITLEGLANKMRIPEESAKIHLDDLIALEIIDRQKGINNKFVYKMKDKFRNLMSKFEGIEMTEKVLEEETPLPVEDPGVPIEQAFYLP